MSQKRFFTSRRNNKTIQMSEKCRFHPVKGWWIDPSGKGMPVAYAIQSPFTINSGSIMNFEVFISQQLQEPQKSSGKFLVSVYPFNPESSFIRFKDFVSSPAGLHAQHLSDIFESLHQIAQEYCGAKRDEENEKKRG